MHMRRKRQVQYVILFLIICFVVFAYYLAFEGSPKKVHNDAIIQTTHKTVTSPTGRKTSLLKASSSFVVPNIVHFVWFGEYTPLEFHHMLSIKSAFIKINPKIIYLHCDHEPIGKWWKYIQEEVTSLKILKMDAPSEIFGNSIIKPEHKSDIARMQILIKYGGIYLDTDAIALKSFDPLRKFEYTMGLEYHGNPGRLNNGIIVSAKNASFLHIWYNTYKNFTKREWDFHDTIIPYHLQYEHPHLIHVEEKSLNYPSGPDRHLIYEKLYDWSKNYAMHLWYRLYGLPLTQNNIKKMNTTFGQIARFIYYNTTKLIT